tara:strand:- start:1176 stop:1508 length:333 start_codon:yes stop_codon:yes gene_type:complete
MIAQREKSLFYRALILSAVDEDLNNNPIEEKEKIPYLRKAVYNAEQSLSFKACKSFLGGLGINIPYENWEILENAKKFGILPYNASERYLDEYLFIYFDEMGKELHEMVN